VKALFVVRHNNDFDSIAPVAHGWAQAGGESIMLSASPELSFTRDFRAGLLQAAGVRLVSLWEVAGRRPDGWLAQRWAATASGARVSRKLMQMTTELAIARHYDPRLAALVAEWRPDIIAFDWLKAPPRRKRFGLFGYQALWTHARAKAVPVVSLPHGLQLFTPPKAEGPDIDSRYALTFVESEEHAGRLEKAGLPREKIAVCGSPRYDPAWVARVVAALGGEPEPATDGHVDIAFFATKKVYDFDFTGLLDWLGELARHPAVRLTIQPHPRGQRAAVFAALARMPNVSVDTRTPASVLIGRAQIVSTLVSSVMVEAVIRGREILYPAFVNTVATRFAEKGACVSLASMGATHAAIDAFIAGRRVARGNYEAFLNETVFGGGGEDTVRRTIGRMSEIATRR